MLGIFRPPVMKCREIAFNDEIRIGGERHEKAKPGLKSDQKAPARKN
jgi:hypothetical protein